MPPQFVHMRVEHNARAGVTLLRDDGAEAVVENVVGIRLHAFTHQLSHGIFIARRAVHVGEFFEKQDNAIA